MTETKQQLILKKWQKILRLSDWDIVLKMCRHYDLPENENGRIYISGSRKEALIKCVVQEDRDKYDFLHNEESTIIHELLHLHFYNIRGEEATTEEEQACHCLTKAFYELGAEEKIK